MEIQQRLLYLSQINEELKLSRRGIVTGWGKERKPDKVEGRLGKLDRLIDFLNKEILSLSKSQWDEL